MPDGPPPTGLPARSPDATVDATVDAAVDAALDAERRHLERSRAALAAMRERTLALDATRAGGGALSIEYLKAALHARAQALLDDPDTPLFFGRLDYAPGAAPGAVADPSARLPVGERFYVGRRHVHDGSGDPLVVDWRAGISRSFYRATRTEPQGVALRRRFGFVRGRLTAYEDEHLLDVTEADRASRILTDEIERPRVGPMRDIVATIQPEQDEIVRGDLATTICVQGAPGTGKTAVGLHRAAYLLYAHRDRLRRSGVLVVGPNAAFLDYIGQVLPALGEVDATQTTVEELVTNVAVRGHDDVGVATLKGDARMAEVLRRAVDASIALPDEALVLPRGARRWRVPRFELREAVESLRGREIRYGAARALLARRVAHAVLVQMENAGETTDDRVQDAVARSRVVRAWVDATWPEVEPRRLLFSLLTDADLLARSADGVLTGEEQLSLRWDPPPRSPGAARWSAADAVLLDELAALVERVPSVGHVVLDEAQDLSPMQLRAVGRRASTGSMTVLGDVAQGTTPWATPSWAASLAHLGKPDAHVEVLERGYRVPALVVDLASRLLPHMAPGVRGPVPVRAHPGRLDVLPVDGAGSTTAAVVAAATRALAREGSVGVVVADDAARRTVRVLEQAGLDVALLGAAPTGRLTVVPATLAKGLEYDAVVVVEPADIVDAEASRTVGLRRLYVVLTRAVSALTVLHARPLPPELAEVPAR